MADTILSLLEPGEYVLNRNAVDKLGKKALDKINYKEAPRFPDKSILADSFESLIGAIYIDGGYNKSYSFIKRIWTPYLNELITNELNPKSWLQEITQKKYNKLPEYLLIKKEGSSHSPKFTVSLTALNFKNIQANGNSIREAEINAAKKVLSLLDEK